MKIKRIFAAVLAMSIIAMTNLSIVCAASKQTVFSAESMFSGDQNAIWQYMTREVVTNEYKNLTYNAETKCWIDGKGGMIGSAFMHTTSDASANHETQVVLQFTCPYSGNIDILDKKGYVSVSQNTSNGVKLWVWKNSSNLANTKITPDTEYVYNFETINTDVKAGDKIRFILSFNGNNEYDGTSISPIIKYVKIDNSVAITDDGTVVNVATAAPATAKAGLYSLADGLSSSQDGVWRYKTREAVTGVYSDMTYDSAKNYWTDGKGGLITANMLHASSDQSAKHEDVTCLQFVAPYGGNLTIYSLNGFLTVSEHSTNGVRFGILKNGKWILPYTIIKGGENYVFQPITIDVTEGDTINFLVSAMNDNSADIVRFTPVVAYNSALPTLASQVTLPKSGTEADGVYNYQKAYDSQQGPVWYYMKREVVTNKYEELTYEKSKKYWVDSKGGIVSETFVHPSADQSATHEMQMTIQFVAPSEGNITIYSADGLVSVSPSSMNGVKMGIYNGANTVMQYTDVDPGEKYIFQPITINVNQGDKISFVFSSKSDNSSDVTKFIPVVVYNAYEKIIPEVNIEVREDDPAQTVYKSWESYGAFVNPWYYKYWELGAAVPKDMTWNAVNGGWRCEEATSCSVNAMGAHPASNINAVRVFKAPKSGYITISVLDDIIKMTSKSVLDGDDGVYVSILLYDGNSSSYVMEKEYLFPDGGSEFYFKNIENIHVYEGWELWFVLDRNVNNQNDAVQFAPMITYTKITDEVAPVYLNSEEELIKNTDYFSDDIAEAKGIVSNILLNVAGIAIPGVIFGIVAGIVQIVKVSSRKRKEKIEV